MKKCAIREEARKFLWYHLHQRRSGPAKVRILTARPILGWDHGDPGMYDIEHALRHITSPKEQRRLAAKAARDAKTTSRRVHTPA